MKKILKNDAILRLQLHNPNIMLVGEYINFTNKTTFKCNVCGNNIYSTFYCLVNNNKKRGCLKCEKRSKNKKERSRSKTHEQYLLDVYNIWGDSIEVIGRYDNASKKIEVKCMVCEQKWSPVAKSILAKHGCPKCGRLRNWQTTTKKHEDYVKEVNNIHGNRIIVVGKYTSNKDKILLKCNKCQHKWYATARNIIKGRGCPKCNLNKGETLIHSILEKLNVDFKFQYVINDLKTDNNGTPIFDFAIFNNGKLTIIIEYGGIQHFKPKKMGR